MNSKNQNPSPPNAIARPLWRRPAIFFSFTALVLCVAMWIASKRGTETPNEVSTETAQGQAVSETNEVASLAPLENSNTSAVGNLPRMPVASVPRPPADAETRALVTSLAEIRLTDGRISKEEADRWKQALQQLRERGELAVPAIREYLEKKIDVSFKTIPDGKQMEYSSLRMALFDTLQSIGGPQATALFAETLQSTADPLEIALIAKTLESQSPGEHKGAILESVRNALQMAKGKELAERDVAPLFGVYRDLGDQSALADLYQASSQWRYYSVIALSEVPNGEGVPLLSRMVKDPAMALNGQRDLALQMLAQSTTRYPEAGEALLEHAKTGSLPEKTWEQIASALSGARLEYSNDPFTATNTGPVAQWHHVSVGNQYFLGRVTAPDLTPEQRQEQIGLINKLSAIAPSDSVRQTLQKARELLQTAPNK